jgi:hypothetical protein
MRRWEGLQVQPETDDKTHVTREFCACDGGQGDEHEDCHIVLYTVRKKKDGDIKEQYFKCEFKDEKKCPAKTKCAPRAFYNKPFKDEPTKMEWIEYACECMAEDDVWPEK